MADMPLYQTTIAVTIQYPGASPEEAYALHKEFVGAIGDAVQALPGRAPDVRADVAASDGPDLLEEQEAPPS